jgi:hypothetical protein
MKTGQAEFSSFRALLTAYRRRWGVGRGQAGKKIRNPNFAVAFAAPFVFPIHYPQLTFHRERSEP